VERSVGTRSIDAFLIILMLVGAAPHTVLKVQYVVPPVNSFIIDLTA
jgi:hypothetical protein